MARLYNEVTQSDRPAPATARVIPNKADQPLLDVLANHYATRLSFARNDMEVMRTTIRTALAEMVDSVVTAALTEASQAGLDTKQQAGMERALRARFGRV